MQDTYFVIDSFQQLYRSLPQLEETIGMTKSNHAAGTLSPS
jgi:hypothetical protein